MRAHTSWLVIKFIESGKSLRYNIVTNYKSIRNKIETKKLNLLLEHRCIKSSKVNKIIQKVKNRESGFVVVCDDSFKRMYTNF